MMACVGWGWGWGWGGMVPEAPVSVWCKADPLTGKGVRGMHVIVNEVHIQPSNTNPTKNMYVYVNEV